MYTCNTFVQTIQMYWIIINTRINENTVTPVKYEKTTQKSKSKRV